MIRLLILLCLVACLSCHRDSGPEAAQREDAVEMEEGGAGNPDRDKAEAFLLALGKVTSAEEERELLNGFGAWLRANDYRIKAELRDGKHFLSCPYFPPDTPWTIHSFRDAGHLELLPLLAPDE